MSWKANNSYLWMLLVCFLISLGALASLQAVSTNDVILREVVGGISSEKSIDLPYKKSSISEANSSNLIHYEAKGIFYLPPLSLVNEIILITDDCPIYFAINNVPVAIKNIPKKGQGCNPDHTSFHIPIRDTALHAGTNDFVVQFEDLGGNMMVSLDAKNSWLKIIPILSIPVIFLWCLAAFLGVRKHHLSRWQTVIAALIITGAVFAITQTYTKLNNTFDEGFHTAAGLQWWQKQSYTVEPMHPPLARLASAALLYANDTVSPSINYRQSGWKLGPIVLGANNDYLHNLTLARMGQLPFYIIGLIMVYSWAGRLYGNHVALPALLLCASLPIISGHAGLANTDAAYAAMYVVFLASWCIWLERPGFFQSLIVGLTMALALLCKFSFLAQMPLAIFLITLLHIWQQGRERYGNITRLIGPSLAIIKPALFIVLPSFVAVIWLIYYGDHFAALKAGIEQAMRKNQSGHAIFLFEPLRGKAVWYYFPVGTFFKLPIAFMLLFLVGCYALYQRYAMTKEVKILYPLIAIFSIYFSSAFANINIGIRHVLPAFFIMSMVAGLGFYKLYYANGWGIKRMSAVLLITWQIGAFIHASPQYFAYFNEFARGKPETILIDTDLDWGQDLFALRDAVKDHAITSLSMCYWGTGSPQDILKIKVTDCEMTNPAYKGWIAISEYSWALSSKSTMMKKSPYQRIGASIRLYKL